MDLPARTAALVSLVDPYPTTSGKPAVLDGFLQFLAARLGEENVHYLLIGGRVPEMRGGSFPVRLHELAAPSGLDGLIGLLRKGLLGGTSLQEALLSSPALGRSIRRKLAELDVDIQIYDTTRVAQHADQESGVRQVCYLEDLHSERYRLMLEAMRGNREVDVQPLGTFAEHVPAVLRPLVASRPVQRALLGLERRRTSRGEVRAARRFDTNLLVNERETVLLRARADVPTGRVLAVPPLVRTTGSASRTWSGAPEFVFLGQLSQPHNDDGMCSFLTEIWPDLLLRRPDAVLRLIGRDPRPILQAAAARFNGSVRLEGFVPDLDAALAGAAALVNPLRFGSGVKIKVMEALSRGLPVVSSPVGADGIDSGPDTGVFVGNSPTEMVDALLRCVDPDVNHAASRAALAHFELRFATRAAFAEYDRAFGVRPLTLDASRGQSPRRGPLARTSER